LEEAQLRKLALDFLVPLFSGAQLDDASVPSSTRDKAVAFTGPCTIEFKAERTDPYRLVLRRSQNFDKVGGGQLTEIDVVRAFVNVVKGMEEGLTAWYEPDLRAMFPRRVVVKSLCQKSSDEAAVLSALDQFMEWASRQYEGKSIPAAVGFVPEAQSGTVQFADMCKYDFSAVLSNGLDTLITCNLSGEVTGYATLSADPASPDFAPYRLSAMAQWATSGHICLVLNRSGDILVFRDKELRFTRRAGRWHFLTPAHVIITQMGGSQIKRVRLAAYETAIDASFARTGACIGIITAGHISQWRNLATSDNDCLEAPSSAKAKVIASMINGKPFHELDRRLRQELVAIDGATLIDHKGNVLAVGAILSIPGGSTGGGRLAAAKALGKLGVGIKVSQDGGIEGYHEGTDKPKFLVMK
jgi:hypothetical protein